MNKYTKTAQSERQNVLSKPVSSLTKQILINAISKALNNINPLKADYGSVLSGENYSSGSGEDNTRYKADTPYVKAIVDLYLQKNHLGKHL